MGASLNRELTPSRKYWDNLEIRYYSYEHFGIPSTNNDDEWKAEHITPYLDDYDGWVREVRNPTDGRVDKEYTEYVIELILDGHLDMGNDN